MSGRLREEPEFQDLDRRVRQLDTTLQQDLHGRRIGNAHDAKNRGDYVTKRQLDQLREDFEQRVGVVEEDVRAALVTGGSESSTPVIELPLATHPIAFGYWLPDGNIPPLIMREHFDEVKEYTDLYIAWFRIGRQYCDSNGTISDMMAVADELVHRAFDAGKGLCLLLDLPYAPGGDIPAHMNRVLDAMTPYWSRVQYIDLADEPSWTKAELEGHAALLRQKMNDRGLVHPLIQVTLAQQGAFGSLQSPMVNANGVDIIGMEAYVDPPGGTAEENEATLRTFLTQAKGRVPASKKIAMVIQAYARNGAWIDIATLTALQTVAYMLAYDDERVVQISMFSYGRASGTREHPELKPRHQAIWQALSGTPSLPTCGGVGNPANCPRYCRGGLHAAVVDAAQSATIAAHPAYFVPGVTPLRLINEPTAFLYIADIVARINTTPSVRAQANAGDAKEIMTKDAVNPQNSEHYALWATNLEVRYNPGAYRATCTPPSW